MCSGNRNRNSWLQCQGDYAEVGRQLGSYKWLFSEAGCICEEKRVNYWSLKQRQMKSGRLSSAVAENLQAKLSSSAVHYR